MSHDISKPFHSRLECLLEILLVCLYIYNSNHKILCVCACVYVCTLTYCRQHQLPSKGSKMNLLFPLTVPLSGCDAGEFQL